MKWRRTLAIWVLLFAPLSVYNLFGAPIFFPDSTVQHVDPRVLRYNFSMTAPVLVAGNFSISFSLQGASTNYRVSSYVEFAEDFMSFGPYGAFQLRLNISENGFYGSHRNNNFGFDNVLPPPIPPTGYGLAVSGKIPPPETNPPIFTHLQSGANTIFLNFTFASFLDNHGEGYYMLSLGPFVTKVTDLIITYSLDAVSELILAVVLFPPAHGVSILITRIRGRRTPKSQEGAGPHEA